MKRELGGQTVLEIGPVLGGGEVHLDVVERLALAEVVVVRGRQQAGAVTSHDRLQVPAMDVEGHSFESVHFLGDWSIESLRRSARETEMGSQEKSEDWKP